MGNRLCAVCGIEIDPPYWLCQSCLNDYGVAGVPFRRWPEYLKMLVIEEQRFERHDKQFSAVSLDELLEVGFQVDTAGNLIAPGDERSLMDRDLLRYAPYDDDVSNRLYRRANGIKER